MITNPPFLFLLWEFDYGEFPFFFFFNQWPENTPALLIIYLIKREDNLTFYIYLSNRRREAAFIYGLDGSLAAP